MKNDGFTIVEILVVIVIIGILALIIIPSSFAFNNTSGEKLLNTKLNIVASTAILWAQDNKECFTVYECETLSYIANEPSVTIVTISLNTLANAGYLEFDEGSKIVNPAQKSTCINNYLLKVTYNKKTRVFSAVPNLSADAAPESYFSCN